MLGFNDEWSSTLALVGLGCDVLGACILTLTAWRATKTGVARLRADVESDARKRRAAVANGGVLLAVGFAFQFAAAWPS